MKKSIFLVLISLTILTTMSFAQSNVLVIDYNNNFSSDQSNNASNIYNRLLATQASVLRVNAIPATINPATYDQVWIFGNMGAPNATTLNPIINYMNAGGAVYIQSEVSCCANPAAFADQLIDATVIVGGSISHTTTKSGNFQYNSYSNLLCNPTISYGAAVRPFQGTPPVNILYEANNTCGGAIGSGDVIGVKFCSGDMISGQGALIVNGDFNIFPLSGTCGSVGILSTPNNNAVIDLIADLLPALACDPNTGTPGTLTLTANPVNFCGSTQLGWTYTPGSGGCGPIGCLLDTTFLWQSIAGDPIIVGTNFSCDTCPYPIASPTQTTTYTLNITIVDTNVSSCGMQNYTVIPITVYPNQPPFADAGIDTTICMGTSFTLGGTPTGAAGNGGPYTYMWSPTTGLSNPTDPNPVYTPSGLGTVTFTVQVDDGSGCPPGIATIDVTTASCCAAVIDSINTTDASCYNTCDGSITISASNTIQYSIDGVNWTPSNTFNNLCPGNYTAYVSDGSCPYSTPFVINSPTAITIPNVVTNVTCNGGNDGEITVAPQGGSGTYNYSWSVPGIGNSPTANNLYAGNVTVTVTDNNGCSEDTTITITEPGPVNVASFQADLQSGCAPLSVNLYNTTDTNLITSFYWDLGDGNTSYDDTVSHVYINPGIYTVTLYVTDNNGCSGARTEINYIMVYENPQAKFSYTPQNVTIFNPTVYFTDLSQFNISSWLWNFDNLGGSSQQHPNFTFPGNDTASYMVTLLVENENGCIDSTFQMVKIHGETGVFVPNAFTPDGDNLNEKFGPQGFGVNIAGYSFKIFNRWGEVIFQSNVPFDGWNGTYKGKLVENGVYSWRLEYKDTNGKRYEQMGKVSIVK